MVRSPVPRTIKRLKSRLVELSKKNEQPEDKKWNKHAVKYLVLKLKKGKKGSIQELVKALQQESSKSKCVLIPKTPDYRSIVTHRRAVPQVVYCRLYRWPELQSHHHIESISTCQNYTESILSSEETSEDAQPSTSATSQAIVTTESEGANPKSHDPKTKEQEQEQQLQLQLQQQLLLQQQQNTICINPYHFDKKKPQALDPVLVPLSRIPPDLSTSFEDSDPAGSGTKAILPPRSQSGQFLSTAITGATLTSLLSDNSPLITQPSTSFTSTYFPPSQIIPSVQPHSPPQAQAQVQPQQQPLPQTQEHSVPQQQQQQQQQDIEQQHIQQQEQEQQQELSIQSVHPSQQEVPMQHEQTMNPQQLTHHHPPPPSAPRQAKLMKTHQGRMPTPHQQMQQLATSPSQQQQQQQQQQQPHLQHIQQQIVQPQQAQHQQFPSPHHQIQASHEHQQHFQLQQYHQQSQYEQEQQHYGEQHQMPIQHHQVPMDQQQGPPPPLAQPQQMPQQQIHHQVPMHQQHMPHQQPGGTMGQQATEIAQPYQFKQNKFSQFARSVTAHHQPIGTQRSYDRHGNVVSRPYTYVQYLESLQKQQQQYPPVQGSSQSYHYPTSTATTLPQQQLAQGDISLYQLSTTSTYKPIQPPHHPYSSPDQAMEMSQEMQMSIQGRYYQAPERPHYASGGPVVHHHTQSLPIVASKIDPHPGQLAIDFQEIPFIEGTNWCSISYHEYDKRLGDKYQARKYVLSVDGYTNPDDSDRYCIGGIPNVHRITSTEWVRRRIGRGVRLSYIDGEVYAECLCDSSIFVSSPLYGMDELKEEFTERVQKLYSGQGTKVFSNPLFSRLLSKAVSRGFEAVYKLTQLCTFRISFIKGWGRAYKRQSIVNAPCWVEVQLNGPLQWIDRVLRQMKPPVGCGSTS